MIFYISFYLDICIRLCDFINSLILKLKIGSPVTRNPELKYIKSKSKR